MTEVALALLGREGRWFLQRRDPGNPVLPGLWEFPGGKAEADESPEEALRRELLEEVGVRVVAASALPTVAGAVRLHPFLVEARGVPRTGLAWGWFTWEELARLPMPPANRRLLEGLSGDPRIPGARRAPGG